MGAFEISAREGNDGWTNINILDSGDGPLTVDAFNGLLLKKYKYKKANRKKGQKTDDDIAEVFGTEEEESDESEEEETDEAKEGKEPEAPTFNEGDVEIESSFLEDPQPGQTIVIGDEENQEEETETRIVIETTTTTRGSDGVLTGGGIIMRGGNRTKYRLHLDKPLLYKHENSKTRIENTDEVSLRKMHGKFESQLKNKYGDTETYSKIKNKIRKLTMDDIKNNLSKPDFIEEIKKTAVDSYEIAKTAPSLPPRPETAPEPAPAPEPVPAPEPAPEPAPVPTLPPRPEPEQSTEINLFLEKDTYKKKYKPSRGEEQAMEFINLVGGYRNMKTTEDEINAQKEIKKDRKEQLESKLKEII